MLIKLELYNGIGSASSTMLNVENKIFPTLLNTHTRFYIGYINFAVDWDKYACQRQ